MRDLFSFICGVAAGMAVFGLADGVFSLAETGWIVGTMWVTMTLAKRLFD